nr:ribonuclease H-like domain-containing protein [Tanacetum cinerariifolium]
MRVPLLHLIFTFPSEPRTSPRVLAYIYNWNVTLLQPLDLTSMISTDIPHQVSKAVDEVVTDAVDWAMQAPLQNRFRDLPEADMKEILHQRMWETDSYKSHEDHMQLYEALEKLMNPDHFEESQVTKNATRVSNSSATSSSSTSRSTWSFRISWSFWILTSTATTSSTSIYQSRSLSISLTPTDLQMDDGMAPDEQAQSSDDEDIRNTHIPKVNLRQDWWKPLEEERPVIPEPAWSILSSDVPVPTNNWASALASNYSLPLEDSLLAQTGDIAMFIGWFCKRQGITKLKHQDLEGPTFEIIKVFHPNMIHLYKSSRYALSISKMKAAYYPDAGLEQMVLDQIHTSEGDRRAVRTHMRILSVVRIEVFSMYGYDYIKKIVLRRADLNEHVIAEQEFKYLYPSDFEDLYLLNLQGYSKNMTENLKLSINYVWKFLGTVCFGNDNVAAIIGYKDLQWGNILITRFCDSDLEVAFRRNTCFVRNLEGVDLLKENRTTNLYTINLHEMASASSICLMPCAISTKSRLRHQRLSHLNFDTINDLAKNDLIT